MTFFKGLEMKKTLFIIAIAVGLLIVSGCQSKPSGKLSIGNRKITIITEPAGAVVKQINILGQPSTQLGVSPIMDQPVVVITQITRMKNMPFTETQQLMKAAGGNVMVRIEKDGYHTYNGVLATKKGETVTHNVTLQEK
jgi:hypothetical protein